jgi:5-methylcytosine-specific restriction endonuclease McrA
LLFLQIWPDILSRRALPAGRLAALGARRDFHHGLLTENRSSRNSGYGLARKCGESAENLREPPPPVSPRSDRATHDRLRRIQDLLRHSVPDGDVETIVDKALTLLLEHAERTKMAATPRPRSRTPISSTTRHIPAAVKRAVWERDGGRCTFQGTEGRCQETGFLEFHHVVPYAAGGETSAENLQLRCRAHNALEAERWFGLVPRVREGCGVWGKVARLAPDRVE